jgi:hypothetical protein
VLVYPPTLDATQTILKAGGTGAHPVRLGRFDWIVVVAPEPGDEHFKAHAFASGALAILSPRVAGGCDRALAASSPFRK